MLPRPPASSRLAPLTSPFCSTYISPFFSVFALFFFSSLSVLTHTYTDTLSLVIGVSCTYHSENVLTFAQRKGCLQSCGLVDARMETASSSRHGTVILIPRPSEDPRDPLVCQGSVYLQFHSLSPPPIRIVRELSRS